MTHIRKCSHDEGLPSDFQSNDKLDTASTLREAKLQRLEASLAARLNLNPNILPKPIQQDAEGNTITPSIVGRPH